MDRETEYELARSARVDSQARDTLVERNMGLVVATAKKFAPRGALLEDLIQEGNIGLLKAVERFEPARDVRFATYAVWWIRAYIIRYLKVNHSHTDVTLDDADEGDWLVDLAPNPEAVAIGRLTDHSVGQAIDGVRSRVGEVGWSVIAERLLQDEPRPLEELGRRWGMSREGVRRVELKTKLFLSRYLAAHAPVGRHAFNTVTTRA